MISILGVKRAKLLIPTERIVQRILMIRNEKVMIDFHLAELYHVETRVLKQAVRRNPDRFPSDFMFTMNKSEIQALVSQNVIPSRSFLGGAKPLAFTEAGVAMLSSILNSRQAIKVNIEIIRTFIELRKMAQNHQAILRKLAKMERRYEGRFREIFTVLRHLISPSTGTMRRIGFRRNDEQ